MLYAYIIYREPSCGSQMEFGKSWIESDFEPNVWFFGELFEPSIDKETRFPLPCTYSTKSHLGEFLRGSYQNFQGKIFQAEGCSTSTFFLQSLQLFKDWLMMLFSM